jgi:hypothetical protein
MVKEGMSRERKLIEQCNDYKGMVKEVQSEYDGIREDYSDLKGLFDKSMSMTKTAFGRIDELQSVMSGGLLTKHLIKPGSRTAEELQRVVNIILQVVPDWRERGAAGILRLTSEENQKVMELMNQQKS